jgi:CRP/FNR family cyclic AMP-dependent transcriptional regulator
MGNFKVDNFLATIGEGRTIVEFVKKQTIYAQGTVCDALFYILDGKVKLTVFSMHG